VVDALVLVLEAIVHLIAPGMMLFPGGFCGHGGRGEARQQHERRGGLEYVSGGSGHNNSLGFGESVMIHFSVNSLRFDASTATLRDAATRVNTL
jgi:hypothetical protein